MTATVSLGILLLAFLASHGAATLHGLHMFQLNSYKVEVQLRWIAKN
jgi:hypothetical protein